MDKLLDQPAALAWGARVEPGHFTGWSLGARFYPVLYLLTRMGQARDWGTGLPLKATLLGKMNRLEVHHIFPKSQLYKRKYKKPEVNALGNFCFLTKDTNLDILARLPEEYFPAADIPIWRSSRDEGRDIEERTWPSQGSTGRQHEQSAFLRLSNGFGSAGDSHRSKETRQH